MTARNNLKVFSQRGIKRFKIGDNEMDLVDIFPLKVKRMKRWARGDWRINKKNVSYKNLFFVQKNVELNDVRSHDVRHTVDNNEEKYSWEFKSKKEDKIRKEAHTCGQQYNDDKSR